MHRLAGFESHGVTVVHDPLKFLTHFRLGNRTMSIPDFDLLTTVPKDTKSREWIVDICMWLNFSRNENNEKLMHSINVNHKKGRFTEDMCFAMWELLKND